MFAHVAIQPYTKTIYFSFWVGVCVAAVCVDGLLRRRFIWASVGTGFLIAAGGFYFLQALDYGSWPWKEFCFWVRIEDLRHWNSEWFDYVLIIIDVAKWYLLPAYTASLVVRLCRTWHEKIHI